MRSLNSPNVVAKYQYVDKDAMINIAVPDNKALNNFNKITLWERARKTNYLIEERELCVNNAFKLNDLLTPVIIKGMHTHKKSCKKWESWTSIHSEHTRSSI